MWCCQDEARKQKTHLSANDAAKRRDNVGMMRFPCQSSLSISCRSETTETKVIRVLLRHEATHKPYYDVSMPTEAMAIIKENLEHSTPGTLLARIQTLYPSVTATQVHSTWTSMSEMYWKKAKDPLESARLLLEEYGDEVDVFEIQPAEGVKMLSFGLKKILAALKDKTYEIGMDATCMYSCF